MKRDRVIIAALLVLLAASLALNWILWQRRGEASVAATGPAGPVARTTPPRERGSAALFEIVANPQLQGRTGRIVLAFADGAAIANTRTVFYPAGGKDMLRVDYGPVAAELPPGEYDLEVTGRKISGLPVETGKDTRVHCGVLRLHGAAQTRFVIYEPGGKDFLHVAYGNAEFGLPAGDYEAEISGVRERVTIESGKITEF